MSEGKCQDIPGQRKFYNRFSYLIEKDKGQKDKTANNQKSTFNFNTCSIDPCRDQTDKLIYSEEPFEAVQEQRKPYRKFKLRSSEFEFFNHKVSQKHSSLSSFLVYTPSKESQQDFFLLDNNQASTFCNTKSFETPTHRNLTQYTEEKTIPITETANTNNKISTFQFSQTQKEKSGNQLGKHRPYKLKITKKQSKTVMPEHNPDRLTITTKKSPLNITQVSKKPPLPEKDKYFITKSPALKTKQMSNKLRESSGFFYQGSLEKPYKSGANRSLEKGRTKKGLKLQGLESYLNRSLDKL